MQLVFVDMAISGMLLFLFAAASRAYPDDRLRFWVAGWACVLIQFAERTMGHGDNAIQSPLIACTLALVGLCFVVSGLTRAQGARNSIEICVCVGVLTIACILLARYAVLHPVWVTLAVLARQTMAGLSVLRLRKIGLRYATMLLFGTFAVVAAGCLYGIWQHQPGIVTAALLGEVFAVAAVSYWIGGDRRDVALYTTTVGLLFWAGTFPAQYFLEHAGKGAIILPEVWSMPVLCAAVGMILMVVKDQLHNARSLGEEYKLLFHNNPHPMWIFEVETLRFVDVNEIALHIHGYTRKEFLSMRLPDLVAPAALTDAVDQARAEQPIVNRASLHLRRDGSILPMDITPYPVEFRGQQCRFVLGVDVSERERLAQQLEHQTHHDSLTGLANRGEFHQQFSNLIASAPDAWVVLIALDISRFKHLNDSYGSPVGDEILRYVARVLVERLGNCELGARIAGDEFAVALTTIANPAAAEQAVSELRDALEQEILVQGHAIRLAFSMGVAVWPEDGADSQTIWSGSESMLRRAQSQGGNQIVWFSKDLRQDAREQIAIESSMRMKLEDAGFHLAYQPVYDFDGTVRGLEALLRLDHPDLGAISPAKVIPIAEETGLIVPLGLWVIEQVCRQVRLWQQQGMRLVPVAINVSAIQLMRADFADRVMALLRNHGVAPRWIHLEVTETAAMRNLKEVSGQMDRLAALGLSFYIDDFGTGHSSLGRLHQLPLSVLKIDRSFIEQLCAPSGTYSTYTSLTIVQAIVSMAHALHQKVVAEGVETRAQLACLCELECDMVQGFLLSRPVAPERIPELVARIHPAFGSDEAGRAATLFRLHCAEPAAPTSI